MNFPSYVSPLGQPIAYVRRVTAKDLPEAMRAQAEGFEMIYAVHDAEGTCLALVNDRQRAFKLARMNELTPVSAH